MKYFPYFLSLLFAAGLIVAAPTTQAEDTAPEATAEITVETENPCDKIGTDRKKQLCNLRNRSQFGHAMASGACRKKAIPGTEEYRKCIVEIKRDLLSNKARILADREHIKPKNRRIERAFVIPQRSFGRFKHNLFERLADRQARRIRQGSDRASYTGMYGKFGTSVNKANAVKATKKSPRLTRTNARRAYNESRINRVVKPISIDN